ncbi:MAG: carbon-nitrogen hydrolase family protein [Cyanobacteria bacterium P01_A01_bin.123]
MKLCIAQTLSKKGDIEANLENHLKLIDLAISCESDLVIFPELSLTNYEPELAKELATHIDDPRLDVLQNISDINCLTIGVGIPIVNDAGISISMIVFQPNKPRGIYSKKYLHSDEEEFFISGNSSLEILESEHNVGLAICYELSVPVHADAAYQKGADIYFASVAKTPNGVEDSMTKLSGIARNFSMVVLMSNCVGECEGTEAGGRSSIFSRAGELVAQLDDKNEGILVYDTVAGSVVKKQVARAQR